MVHKHSVCCLLAQSRGRSVQLGWSKQRHGWKGTQQTCMHARALQSSGDEDALGNPYGFTNVPLPHHTPSYPLLVTTQMSRERSVSQLVLMSEGHYLSTDTGTMVLRLVSYNADAKSLAYLQLPFHWQEAGVIVGSPPLILALPVLPYSSYASSRCAMLRSSFLCPDWMCLFS